MGSDPPRWRIRLSTLMLLVVILALDMALVISRVELGRERRRAGMSRMMAEEARRRAGAMLQQALKPQPPVPPAAGE